MNGIYVFTCDRIGNKLYYEDQECTSDLVTLKPILSFLQISWLSAAETVSDFYQLINSTIFLYRNLPIS
jgi:hypothetical protein